MQTTEEVKKFNRL